MHKNTMAFLRELFAPEPVPLYLNPSTGEEVIDMKRVCDKRGLDFEAQLRRMQDDPIGRHSLSRFDQRKATRVMVPDPRTP